MAVDMVAGRDVCGRQADGKAVLAHGRTGGDGRQRQLVTLRNVGPRDHVADPLPDGDVAHGCGDVVTGIDAVNGGGHGQGIGHG